MKKILKSLLPASITNFYKKTRYSITNINFQPKIIDKEAEGVRFQFFIGNAQGRQWYDNHNRDSNESLNEAFSEFKYIKENLVKKRDSVVEVGCHHGLFTVYLSKLVGEAGRVYAFEALPINAGIAEKNISLNNLKNVEIINKAVGNDSGKTNITLDGNSSVTTSKRNSLEIDICSLDHFFRDIAPNFLKIDVEGYEYEVLCGAQSLLNSNPNIELEVHTPELNIRGITLDRIFKQLPLDEYENVMINISGTNELIQYHKDFNTKKRFHLFAFNPRE